MAIKDKESIITDYMDISAFSGRPTEHKHHCIFGSGLRKLADEDLLIIPLTAREHNMGAPTECIHGNPAAEKLSRMVGQLAWEKHWIANIIRHAGPLMDNIEDDAREAFRKRYGCSYL